jgi:GMP synthase PP-ATPase subunit
MHMVCQHSAKRHGFATFGYTVGKCMRPWCLRVQIDAKDEMMDKLRGVTDPEAKRKAIGREFIECFMRFRCAVHAVC